jgi:hypothetical protein
MMPAARGCGSDDTALLGVPIIQRRQLLGVLVVQQRELRQFDESEESFLVTLATQMAAILSQSQLNGDVFKAGMLLRIGEVDRFGQPPHQADKTFIKCECDCAPAGFFQPARGHQVIAASIVVSRHKARLLIDVKEVKPRTLCSLGCEK